MSIDGDYAPLRRGTRAIVRQASLSGIANRYVDLTMPAQSAPKIPDGGVIEQDATTSAVDLDQVFNTFDPETRKDLQRVFKGSDEQYKGQAPGHERGPALPQPVAVGLEQALRRAQPRHAAARALHRLLLQARDRRRGPP